MMFVCIWCWSVLCVIYVNSKVGRSMAGIYD